MIVFGEVVLMYFVCLGNHLGVLMTTNLATWQGEELRPRVVGARDCVCVYSTR